jgi:hypothetical protein
MGDMGIQFFQVSPCLIHGKNGSGGDFFHDGRRFNQSFPEEMKNEQGTPDPGCFFRLHLTVVLPHYREY